MPYGTIYLIPVPLADDAAGPSFTSELTRIVNTIDEYIVENEKTARKFLKQAGLQKPQRELVFHNYGKHARNQADLSVFFKSILAGKDVGLMSEAGCPGIADPGADIVAEAHRSGIRVVPLVGPSAILLALMAAGFNGQSFVFHGYLPIEKSARTSAIKSLEKQAYLQNQTQVFIEAPFRNNQLLAELQRTCKPQTLLCIAVDLTAATEQIIRLPLHEWKRKPYDFHKRPAIFLVFSDGSTH